MAQLNNAKKPEWQLNPGILVFSIEDDKLLVSTVRYRDAIPPFTGPAVTTEFDEKSKEEPMEPSKL